VLDLSRPFDVIGGSGPSCAAITARAGLLLLCLRATGAMGTLFAIYFDIIPALFLVLPYSKFLLGLYFARSRCYAGKQRDQNAASVATRAACAGI
jgi:hypothetical protein